MPCEPVRPASFEAVLQCALMAARTRQGAHGPKAGTPLPSGARPKPWARARSFRCTKPRGIIQRLAIDWQARERAHVDRLQNLDQPRLSSSTAMISARGVITSSTRRSRSRRMFATIVNSAGELSRNAGPERQSGRPAVMPRIQSWPFADQPRNRPSKGWMLRCDSDPGLFAGLVCFRPTAGRYRPGGSEVSLTSSSSFARVRSPAHFPQT